MKTTPLKLFLFFIQAIGFICTSYLPIYLLHKGYSATEVGMLLAIGPFASLLSEPIGGYVSDKIRSIKKVLLFCIAGMIFSGFVFFQLDSFTAMAILIYCLFFFLAPTGGLSDSLSQKTADKTNVSFGSIRMWGSLGYGISSITIGYLLSYLGVDNIVIPFMFFCVSLFIIGIFLTDIKVTDGSESKVNFKDAFLLLKSIRFTVFLIIVLFITLGHRANDLYLSVFIQKVGGTETTIGWAFFWGVATEVLVFFTSGYWYRKYKDLTFIIFAALLYGIRFIGMSFASSSVELIFYQLLHGVTFGVFFTVALSYVTKIVPARLQSTGHVLLISVFFGYSGMISALVGGKFIDTYSIFSLYLLIGCAAIFGAVLLMIYSKFVKVEKQTNRITSSL
ncbi:MFS transporter [Metabacillus litoralis]|uniref:MFS transporter n=1 Tax=Metabacillus litoralis TaxID=152268 RepID=A0A5C6W0J6_9BACI|nr:MFS transporter [Metabacillus litoralis]TXC90489.1 MFS transporter [Metabacillus litoralis]